MLERIERRDQVRSARNQRGSMHGRSHIGLGVDPINTDRIEPPRAEISSELIATAAEIDREPGLIEIDQG